VRLGAWLIDVSLTIAVMLLVMYRYSGGIDAREFVLQTNYTQLVVLLGVPFIAHIVFMSSLGASVGMCAMDLMLVKDNSEPVAFSNLLRRPLGILGLFATAGLAAALPFLNDGRRSLGDVMSGTRVIESPAPGRRIAYDTWRLFKSSLRALAPVTVAAAIALLLLNKSAGPNKTIFLDALLLAGITTLLLASLSSVLRSKLTRVRLTPSGIQRSGLFGWRKGVIAWSDIDFARYRHARVCPYLELHRHNYKRFRVPIEHDTAQLTVHALTTYGVRIEQ